MNLTLEAQERFWLAQQSLKNKIDDLAMTASKRNSLLCEIFYMEEAFKDLLADRKIKK